jgi:hypothetical protein
MLVFEFLPRQDGLAGTARAVLDGFPDLFCVPYQGVECEGWKRVYAPIDVIFSSGEPAAEKADILR